MYRIAAIARKELLDILRDRRTMLVMLVTAIAAGPVMLMLVLNLIASQAEKVQDLKLPAVGLQYAPALASYLKRAEVALEQAPDDYERKIRAGDLDIVLEVDASFATAVAEGRPASVRLTYDRSRDRARATIGRVEALLGAFSREWGRGRLLLRGVSPDVAEPLVIDARDLATPQSSGSMVLFLVAYYGLFATLMGGMAAALDTTAGERERSSLEPLLMTPARPAEIVVGKWIAIVALDAAVVLLTLSGFYLTLRFGPLPSVGIPFLFGAREFGRFVVVLAPLMLLAPAALLYVGARGRTLKEAQSNVSVLLFVVSILPLLQLFMQQKEPAWLPLVPVSGHFALLSKALRGEALPGFDLALAWAGPTVLASLVLLLVARLLSRESVLAGRG